ncbi:MAG: hypothetical protein ACJATI_001589 [Halioglobus sp.]|jgi:hypothetical protein
MTALADFRPSYVKSESGRQYPNKKNDKARNETNQKITELQIKL